METEDLVRRLREDASSAWGSEVWILREAADEIERLRECLKEAKAAANAFLRELGQEAEAAPKRKIEIVEPFSDMQDNGDRWENEGGVIPAVDFNHDLKDVKFHDPEIWSNERGAPIPADDSNFDNSLEGNVKDAIRKRKNVLKIREIDLTDDDWYHGC